MADKKKKESLIKKDTRELPVKLTEAEITEYGRQIAKLELDARSVDNEKKNAAEGFKGRAADIAGQMSSLAQCVRDGQEHRWIDVEITFDIKTATRTTTRTDTQEVVNTAPMTAQEIREVSQGDLPFEVVDGGVQAEA